MCIIILCNMTIVYCCIDSAENSNEDKYHEAEKKKKRSKVFSMSGKLSKITIPSQKQLPLLCKARLNTFLAI